MDESKVKFGDKLFLQGWYLNFIDNFSEKEYNAIRGFMTVGGIESRPIQTNSPDASVAGFVVDLGYEASLALAASFSQAEMVEVTDKLCLLPPLPSGTKIWMPVTYLP